VFSLDDIITTIVGRNKHQEIGVPCFDFSSYLRIEKLVGVRHSQSLTYGKSLVPALCDYIPEKSTNRNLHFHPATYRTHYTPGKPSDYCIPARMWGSKPIAIWHCPTSAYRAIVKPILRGAWENPNPGRLRATTWKLGCSGDTSVNIGRIFRTSRKLPAPSNQQQQHQYFLSYKAILQLTSMNK
jgi:hypothetical protein